MQPRFLDSPAPTCVAWRSPRPDAALPPNPAGADPVRSPDAPLGSSEAIRRAPTGLPFPLRTMALASALLVSACNPGCSRQPSGSDSETPGETGEEPTPTNLAAEPSDSEPEAAGPSDDRYAADRERLVSLLETQPELRDERVFEALRKVPRHELVPEGMRGHSYEDRPLPIGEEQTISQPYIVALMTQLADVQPDDVVLEVGTGSGYQAAVLGQLADEVYTIEIVRPLGERAKRDLERLGLADNIHFRIGDGWAGWPEHAPFDAVVVTAAPPDIPEPLKEQLAVGGRLVIPVGEDYQELRVLEKTADGLEETRSIPVRFVPMTGKAQEK